MHAVDPEARGLGDFCSDAFATVCFVGRCGCIGCESGSSSIGCLGQLQILGGLNGEFCPPVIYPKLQMTLYSYKDRGVEWRVS